jgi:5-methyltetrahydrofolate--homocysteine methyltransferase
MAENTREELTIALKQGSTEQAEAATRKLLDEGMDPLAIIQEVLVPALTEVGDDFQEFRIFLPELMKAGEAARVTSEMIENELAARGGKSMSLGTVVIGTVENDVHDIGKNIVSTLLKAHGFKVVDLGRSVTPSAFLQAAERENADIIAMSALMTTTRPATTATIDIFEQVGKRDTYKIIIGGGSVSKQWASDIGADGYAEDAAGAVTLCKQLVAG